MLRRASACEASVPRNESTGRPGSPGRRDVGPFGSEEVPVPRTSGEGKAQRATERAVLLGAMVVGSFVAATARDRESARLGDGLDQRGLTRAVLADQVRHGGVEGQVEAPDERQTVREPLKRRHALGNDADPLEEGGSHHLGGNVGMTRLAKSSSVRSASLSPIPPKLICMEGSNSPKPSG